MRKIKYIIISLILCISLMFSNITMINNSVSVSASMPIAPDGTSTLASLLMMLISLVASSEGINLDLPSHDVGDWSTVTFDLYVWLMDNKPNIINDILGNSSNWYNVNELYTLSYAITNGYTIDPLEYVTAFSKISVTSDLYDNIVEFIKIEFGYEYLGNIEYDKVVKNHVLRYFSENNPHVSTDNLNNSLIFTYNNILVSSIYAKLRNGVIGFNNIPKLVVTRGGSTYNYYAQMKIVFETATNSMSYVDVSNELVMTSSGISDVDEIILYNYKGSNYPKSWTKEKIEKYIKYTSFPLQLDLENSSGLASDIENGYTFIGSAITYEFIQSLFIGGLEWVKNKLGAVDIVIDDWWAEEIAVNNIDDFETTDDVVYAVQQADIKAREKHKVVIQQKIDTRTIAEDIPLEYTEILDITNSIDENFNNSLGAINFETTDFPEYLLVGLSFVAWVFGQIWLSMGSYSIVLVFVASISLVAVLFGLGLKRQKTSDKSESGSKPSKTKKK